MDETHLHSCGEQQLSKRSVASVEARQRIEVLEELDADRIELAKFGKKQALKVITVDLSNLLRTIH